MICWQLGGRSLHDLSVRHVSVAEPTSVKPGWHSKRIVEPGTKPPTTQDPCSGASGTGQTTGSQAGSSPDHRPLLKQILNSFPIPETQVKFKNNFPFFFSNLNAKLTRKAMSGLTRV